MMHTRKRIQLFCLLTMVLIAAELTLGAEQHVVLDLWPNGTPGPVSEKQKVGPEKELFRDPPDGVVRLTNVTKPQITLYRPKQSNGAAVLVCPGGGYSILAYEHEGTKVCEFLNSHGVTAVSVSYTHLTLPTIYSV